MSWMHVKSTELITNVISISTIVCKTTNYIYMYYSFYIIYVSAYTYIKESNKSTLQ